MEDLARRSGSPSLLAKSEFQPFQNQTQTTTASSETRQWPDAKQEIMAKFLQSHPREQPEREPMAPFAASAKPPVQTSDPLAEIYARLPPLDPASVADLWTEEVEDDEEIGSTKPKPVVSFDNSIAMYKMLIVFTSGYGRAYRQVAQRRACWN